MVGTRYWREGGSSELNCPELQQCFPLPRVRDNARTRTIRRDLEEVSSAKLSGGLQGVTILIQE